MTHLLRVVKDADGMHALGVSLVTASDVGTALHASATWEEL